MKQILVHQFTFVGSPQIWQGDEMGMWGGDDPDDRKPLIWSDYKFEDENRDAFGNKYENEPVIEDVKLLSFYKKIISIRKNNSELVYGDVNYFITDDANNIFGYIRTFENTSSYVIFNMNTESKNVNIKLEKSGKYIDLLSGKEFDVKSPILTVSLDGKSSLILKLAK